MRGTVKCKPEALATETRGGPQPPEEHCYTRSLDPIKFNHMKYLALFLSSTALCCAGGFSTGQAARAIIGQTTFTAQQAGDPTSTDFRLGAVSGLAYANGRLFVVDSNRVQASPVQNRVLIYKDIKGLIP